MLKKSSGERANDYYPGMDFHSGGEGGGGTHVLHAVVVRHLTTPTREDGASSLSERFPMPSPSFVRERGVQ